MIPDRSFFLKHMVIGTLYISGILFSQPGQSFAQTETRVASATTFFLPHGTTTATTATVYGSRTSYSTLDGNKTNSALHIKFDDRTRSGFQITLPPGKTLDLSSNRQNAFIQFKIKGKHGNEQFNLGIIDNGSDGISRTTVWMNSSDYFLITGTWQDIICPISGFHDQGERLIEPDSIGEIAHIDWRNISGICLTTAKEQNYGKSDDRLASVYIDDLKIVITDQKQSPERLHTPWKLLEDTTSGPPQQKSDDILFSWIDSALSPKTSVYTYGEPSDYKILPPNINGSSVFATYMNDKEWSGVTLYRNKKHSIDVSPYYKTGGIEFCVKGSEGGELFSVGLLDDDSDGTDRKVESRFQSRKFVRVSKEWQTVRIPFSAFDSIGRWWNTDAHYEVVGTVDWSKMAEIRFSINKYENRKLSNNSVNPVKLYFSSIRFLKNVNIVSNEIFWKSFRSEAPDQLIDDFNSIDGVNKWMFRTDPASSIKMVSSANELDNSNAVAMDYKIKHWGSAYMVLPDTDTIKRNWSYHNSVTFDFYSSEKVQTCMVMIVDAGNEAWNANFNATSGWQKISIHFSRFRQFDWWQPENADLNGKMDMNAVTSFDFRPGTNGKSGTIVLDNLSIRNITVDQKESVKHIRTNQIGYLVNYPKEFTVTDSLAHTYTIADVNNEVVHYGTLSAGRLWPVSGEYIRTGEFSGMSHPGTYKLTIIETGDTTSVSIISGLPSSLLRDALRTYYFQRASIDIKEAFAGTFARTAGHPDTACILHATTSKTGTRNVTGGWYDAGDYGKYIVNAGISCATLLSLYELYPALISDSLNIPESHNNISDLLDEVRYEVEWMIRMQDDDGGVFFKIGTLEWDEFNPPSKATAPRYLIGKTTSSTLNFAAVLAQASRLFRKFDKPFSIDCQKRALQAWNWAQNNPSVPEPNEIGGTGAYADNWFNDEFFWAACQLYITTKKPVFKKQIANYGASTEMNSVANWQKTGNLGWFSIASAFNEEAFNEVKQANIYIRSLADHFIRIADSTPYRIPSSQFTWGSNSELLNHAIVMCYAYKLTNLRKYLNATIDIVNYIFGNNATGFSFVTGYGSNFPTQPHNRIIGSDEIDEPIPGFLVGGPNVFREDELSSEPGVLYPFKEPARSYIDRTAAFASNETCINWNAALVFVLGFLTANQ